MFDNRLRFENVKLRGLRGLGLMLSFRSMGLGSALNELLISATTLQATESQVSCKPTVQTKLKKKTIKQYNHVDKTQRRAAREADTLIWADVRVVEY